MHPGLIKILAATTITERYRLLQMHVSQLEVESSGLVQTDEMSNLMIEHHLRHLSRNDVISICAELDFLREKNSNEVLFMKVCHELRSLLLHHAARPNAQTSLDDIEQWRKQIEPFLAKHDATKLNMLPSTLHQMIYSKLPTDTLKQHGIIHLSNVKPLEVQQIFSYVRRYDVAIMELMTKIEHQLIVLRKNSRALENKLKSFQLQVKSDIQIFENSRLDVETSLFRLTTSTGVAAFEAEIELINDILNGPISFAKLLKSIIEKQILASERGLMKQDLDELYQEYKLLQDDIVAKNKAFEANQTIWRSSIVGTIQHTASAVRHALKDAVTTLFSPEEISNRVETISGDDANQRLYFTV